MDHDIFMKKYVSKTFQLYNQTTQSLNKNFCTFGALETRKAIDLETTCKADNIYRQRISSNKE